MTKILPILNATLWSVQCATSAFYAHSLGLAALGAVGILVSALQWWQASR